MGLRWPAAPPRLRRSAGRQADCHAVLSASGHRSMGRDRIAPSAFRGLCCAGMALDFWLLRGLDIKLHLLAHDLAELHGGLRGLQADVEAGGGLDVAVAEKPPDGFVVARSFLEVDRGGGVPELVC